MIIKHYSTLFFISALLIFVSCHRQNQSELLSNATPSDSTSFPLPGDSTIYGLACEGCTDSVVILLPEDYSDPIQFNIIEAMKRHRVTGHPKVGDRIAVIVSSTDSLTAERVICIDDLYGQWCYKLMPELEAPSVPDAAPLPDSVLNKIMVEREYGISLHRGWGAATIGNSYRNASIDQEELVRYPTVPYYSRWYLWNGQLLLVKAKMKMDGENNPVFLSDGIDTCNIELLGPDSLVLQFTDHQQSYYRKP